MTDVLEINDLASLRSFQLDWTCLHGETPGANFFHAFDWIEVYWKHFSEGKRLRVLVIRSEGKPIGIVPLIEKVEVGRLGSVRVLTYPLDDWGFHYGPVGASQTAVLALAMRHLTETPRTWDIFEPRWIPSDTIDRGRTETAMRIVGLEAKASVCRETSVIDLSQFEDWEAYLASRSKKARHEVRRHLRKLDASSELRFVRHRPEPRRHGDGDPRWDLYDDCLQVSEKSWQAESGRGNTLCQPQVRQFLRDAHERAARLGMVDLGLLYQGNEPVAYWYNYHHQGELLGLRTGYDTQGPSGAGTELLGCMLRDSFERGDHLVDLGVGDEPYKKRLRTGTRICQQLTHVKPTAIRSRALRAVRQLRRSLAGQAGPQVAAV